MKKRKKKSKSPERKNRKFRFIQTRESHQKLNKAISHIKEMHQESRKLLKMAFLIKRDMNKRSPDKEISLLSPKKQLKPRFSPEKQNPPNKPKPHKRKIHKEP